MLKLMRSLFALCLCLIPQLTFAAIKSIEEFTKEEIFSVTPADPSFRFLEELFGTVGPVLHGTTGMLLGLVFKVFNVGIIVVASVFLIWATVKTVIGTSQEGQFMGQQAKSSWLVLRTVLGLGLLTPSFTTGYSVIQIFVMWVVVQGVGFANTAWKAAVDYIEDAGPVLAEPTIPTAEYINLVGTILQMEVCMYTHEQIENKKRNEASSSPPTGGAVSPDATRFSDFRYQRSSTSFYFPKQRGNKDAGCGQVSWVLPNKPANSTRENLTKQALELVITGLAPAAKRIAEQYSASPQNLPDLTKRADDLATNRVLGGSADFINIVSPLRTTGRFDPSILVHYISPQDIQQILSKIYATQAAPPTDIIMTLFFNKVRERGWIYAGSFYYVLGKFQGEINSGTSVQVNVINGPYGFSSVKGVGRYIMFNMASMTPTYTKEDEEFPEVLGHYYDQVQRAVARAKESYNDARVQLKRITVAVGLQERRFSPFLDPIIDNQNQALDGFSGAAIDPVLKLEEIGRIMMQAALIAWIVITLTVFFVTLAGSLWPMFNPAGFAFISMFTFFAPIFLALISAIFVQGAILSVYVPFVPFLIFSFSVLGWFAIVVEAMVAAPLVALGMTHPEGHDLLGAAEQAVMLLLSVLLRPILMIIGLIAGMLLSRIGVYYLDEGFITVLTAFKDQYQVLTFIALFFMYCAALIAVIHTAFNMIHQIPSQVMRWVGVTGDTVGGAVQEALSGAKGGAESGGGVIGEGMKSSARSLTGFSKQYIKERMQEAGKDEEASAEEGEEQDEEEGEESGSGVSGGGEKGAGQKWQKATPKTGPKIGGHRGGNSTSGGEDGGGGK